MKNLNFKNKIQIFSNFINIDFILYYYKNTILINYINKKILSKNIKLCFFNFLFFLEKKNKISLFYFNIKI